MYEFYKPTVAPKIITTRDLKHLDASELTNMITAGMSRIFPLTDELQSMLDVEALAGDLTKTVVASYDALAPLNTIVLTSKRKPWADETIRDLMKERDEIYKSATQTGSLVEFKKFCSLRSQVRNRLDSAKNIYISKRLSNAPDLRARWAVVKSMGFSSSAMPSPFSFFTPDQLNNHYASISNATPPISIDTLNDLLSSPRHNFVREEFDIGEFSDSEVLAAILKAKSKATGADGISIAMIKTAAPALVKPLRSLFNASMNRASFPSLWKKALLLPLSKVKSPLSPSDTRSIAKLPELSKILELLVHNRLRDYLEKHGLLDPCQAGYRSGHSTQTALLGVLENIRQAIDDRKITILILFDFSKAFDTISHDILLRKMKNINCSDNALKWFFTYLHDRIQAVVDDGGRVSEWVRSNAGVPQGSVLGPLLFSLFINDLPNVLSGGSKHMISADDTQIYRSFLPHEFTSGLSDISRDATAVANWAVENGLQLNLRKTKAMILGNEQYISRIDLDSCSKININGHNIPYVTEALNLGVWLTPTLDWDKHLNAVSCKVYRTLNALKHRRHALSRNVRKSLVEALIFPHFDYACVVFHSLNNTQNLKLHRLLNACVRFVHGRIPYDARVTPYRLALGWLSVAHRREYFLGVQAFNAISRGNPEYLATWFADAKNISLRRSSRRQTENVYFVIAPRTEAKKSSFHILSCYLLNSLKPLTFDPSTINSFKAYLFDTLSWRDISDWRSQQSLRSHL